MNGMFQVNQDVNGAYNGWYTCPECGRANLLFAQDTRHECSCGKFMIDLGQPLQAFVASCHAGKPVLAAAARA